MTEVQNKGIGVVLKLLIIGFPLIWFLLIWFDDFLNLGQIRLQSKFHSPSYSRSGLKAWSQERKKVCDYDGHLNSAHRTAQPKYSQTFIAS